MQDVEDDPKIPVRGILWVAGMLHEPCFRERYFGLIDLTADACTTRLIRLDTWDYFSLLSLFLQICL
jgi:hypothetical protein